MSAVVPLLIGAMVVLTGILILLAWRMARRVRRESDRRADLLHRALDASEIERRRIAADLHDGVVQDLAGVTYSLAAMADQNRQPELEQGLTRNAATTRNAVRSLRTLLVDIYPASLAEAGLTAALMDLLSSLPPGTRTSLSTPEDLTLPEEQQAALYRAAREALQNVAKHSNATSVEVTLVNRSPTGAVLTVADDGGGFDPGKVPAGHLGLTLLRDLATGVGGGCTIDSQPGKGTVVVFEVPG